MLSKILINCHYLKLRFYYFLGNLEASDRVVRGGEAERSSRSRCSSQSLRRGRQSGRTKNRRTLDRTPRQRKRR